MTSKRTWIGEAYHLRKSADDPDRIDVLIGEARRLDAPRALILGDSFSLEDLDEVYDGAVGTTAIRLLRDFLAAENVFTLNLAVGGTGPLDYLRRLERYGRPYRPHLVIVNYYAGYGLTATQDGSAFARALSRRLGASALGRFLLDRRAQRITRNRLHRIRGIIRENRALGDVRNPFLIERARTRPDHYIDNLLIEKPESRRAWETNEKAFLRMRAIAGALGARLLITIFPSPLQIDGEHLLFYGRLGFRVKEGLLTGNRPQDLLKRFCRQRGIHFLDMLPAFRERSARQSCYLENDDHWNQEGNRLAFELIREKLTRDRLLPSITTPGDVSDAGRSPGP